MKPHSCQLYAPLLVCDLHFTECEKCSVCTSPSAIVWCNCGHRCMNPCSRSAVTPNGPGCRPDALCLLCWLENWLSSCWKSGLASTRPDPGGGGGGVGGHSASSLTSNIDWQQWPRGPSASQYTAPCTHTLLEVNSSGCSSSSTSPGFLWIPPVTSTSGKKPGQGGWRQWDALRGPAWCRLLIQKFTEGGKKKTARRRFEKSKIMSQNVGQDPQLVWVASWSQLRAPVPLVSRLRHTQSLLNYAAKKSLKMQILIVKLCFNCCLAYIVLYTFK